MLTLMWVIENGENIGAIVTLLIALFGAFHSVYAANRNLREAIHALMLRAEKARKNGELGDINGEQVMEIVIAKVITMVVPKLPVWVRPFVTEAYVRRVAQFLYDKARDYLDDGKFNNSLKGVGADAEGDPT